VEAALSKFAIECCRIDLLPSVALEHLRIHSELCAMKWANPTTWLKEGFAVSGRIDSMKRHYESIHARDLSEDHMAHLIWGFMAIIHVVAVFPQLNNLQETPHCQHSELQQHREHSKSPCNRSSTTCDTQTAVALWRACTLHTLRCDSNRGALAHLCAYLATVFCAYLANA